MSDRDSASLDYRNKHSGGWKSSLVKDAMAWHSPAVSTGKKSPIEEEYQFDKTDSIEKSLSQLENGEQDSEVPVEDGNIFRLANEITNKAFSAARETESLGSLKTDNTTPSNNVSPEPKFQSHLLRRGMSLSEQKVKPRYGRSAEFVHQYVGPSVCPQNASTFAEYITSRNGKLIIAMVGLPARGKSFIAMGIKRHLDWLGLETRIFNAGNYRRKVSAEMNIDSSSAAFFESSSKEGVLLRQRCAEEALSDAFLALFDPHNHLSVAIFDATNTTKERRAWLADEIRKANLEHDQILEGDELDENEEDKKSVDLGKKKRVPIQLAFAETVLTDDQTVWENIKEAKLNSPDYAGVDPDVAMKDFFARISAYKKVYERVENDEGLPYIRLTNAGEELLCHKCTGYTLGRVGWLMGSMRLTPRPILLTRCGESTNESFGRIGGNPALTQIGQLFAKKLQGTIKDWIEKLPPGLAPVVWTSTLLRAQQTICGLIGKCPIMSVHMLDEIKAGAAEGMTHAEMIEQFPPLMKARAENKLEIPFPGGGESYLDLFKRIEPLLLGLVAETQPVIIVAHLGVLRVIYSYLMGIEPRKCPYLEIPMHCVVQLNPKGYGYEEWRHFPL